MKKRLDQLLCEKSLAPDTDIARRLIGAGEVYVNEAIVDKAGALVDEKEPIRLKESSPFVSRGGMKLNKALEYFHIEVQGKICLDVGASTGGFTDCLLQHGAAKVFAVDVAYGQLAWKLRQDERVVVVERCNARYLDSRTLQGENMELAVTDVSFISLTSILPAMIATFSSSIDILALIKPQFELSRTESAGGVISDPALHQKAIDKIKNFVSGHSRPALHTSGVVPSPILGPKGNKEFIIHITS